MRSLFNSKLHIRLQRMAGARVMLLFGLLVLAAPKGSAQERLTLQDAISKALEKNFDVLVARNSADQATRNNTWGNAGILPTLSLNGAATKSSTTTRQQFSDGRSQNRRGAQSTGYNASADLDWTLFDGGRMFLNKKQLGELADLEKARLKERVLSVVAQTIQAYAAAVYQKQQGVAIDTGLVLAQTRMYLSQVKFETGAAAKVDFLQARVDYNARQSDSLNQEAALVRAFASLNALMAEEEIEKSYIVDDSLSLNMMLEPGRKELLQGNPTLDVARRTAAISKLDFRIAKTYQLPTLAVNGSYVFTRNSNQAGLQLFNRSYGPSGGVGVNIPIYQGGNVRRTIAIARLEAVRNELLYSQQNTELGRQYRSAWANYLASVAGYKLESENIGYAKENMDIQKARFRLGVGTTLETREAENSYVAALVRLYTAAYNVKVNETAVLQLEGRLVQ